MFHTHPPFWVHRRNVCLLPFFLCSQISRGGSGPGFFASPNLSLLSQATSACFRHVLEAIVVWLGAMPVPVSCRWRLDMCFLVSLLVGQEHCCMLESSLGASWWEWVFFLCVSFLLFSRGGIWSVHV